MFTIEYKQDGFPDIKLPIIGRPLPEGMSKCIKGFYVQYKDHNSEQRLKLKQDILYCNYRLSDAKTPEEHKMYYREYLEIFESKLKETTNVQ